MNTITTSAKRTINLRKTGRCLWERKHKMEEKMFNKIIISNNKRR